MYKVRGIDGKEYGPVSAEVLRQWLSERRLTPQTMVQQEGSTEWRPVSSVPELASLFGTPMPPPSTPAVPTLPPGTGPAPRPTPATPPYSPAGAAPAYGAAVQPKTSGLAIASLILGILGACGITALLGIIFGVISLKQIRQSKGQLKGEGLAIAGLCIAAFMFLFPFGAAMLLPALAKAKDKAQQIQCMNNMKQVGLGLQMWARDNGEKFPPDLISISNEVTSPKILVCPGEKLRDRKEIGTWDEFSLIGSSYDYYGAGKKTTNPQEVILSCPIHGNSGLADGSVRIGPRRGVPRTR
jgi:hypothetical protein